jgi:hypothetical protein
LAYLPDPAKLYADFIGAIRFNNPDCAIGKVKNIVTSGCFRPIIFQISVKVKSFDNYAIDFQYRDVSRLFCPKQVTGEHYSPYEQQYDENQQISFSYFHFIAPL